MTQKNIEDTAKIHNLPRWLKIQGWFIRKAATQRANDLHHWFICSEHMSIIEKIIITIRLTLFQAILGPVKE